MRRLSSTAGLVLVFCILVPAWAENIHRPEATAAFAERSSVRASEFMVSTAHPLATQAGYDILAAGGSAADAAVAVQAMLGLVEPQSSGLGGGGFLLYWDAATAQLSTYDARETAPLAADGDYWLDERGRPLPFQQAVLGGRSAGVPGIPRLLETIHDDHGLLSFAQALHPAIETARAGFPVSARLAQAIARAEGLEIFPETSAYLHDAEGLPLQQGAILHNEDYALTLEAFAEEGADIFYEGAIAQAILSALSEAVNPSILTATDFAAYQVIERRPRCIDYRAYQVCGMGPPSSGGIAVAQILKMLEPFDLAALGDSVLARHLFVEACRLAFADRDLYLADSDFVSIPQGLLDPAYLDARAALIDPDRSIGTARPGSPPWAEPVPRIEGAQPPENGTTHFVIVDGSGNMVSATTTIETSLGNRVMAAGFLLNNELTDFSFRPGTPEQPVANAVEPGKRPRSSMAPTIVFADGRPILLTGSPGGAEIIPYTAFSIIAVLDWGMDPQHAIDLPLITNLNGTTFVERGEHAEALASALRQKGHEVAIADLNSGLHLIAISDNAFIGAADKRRDGRAMGR